MTQLEFAQRIHLERAWNVEIISIGVDVVEIPRIRSMVERFPRRFVDRVYTDDEQKRLGTLKDPAPYLSGRWAVKEAVLKALGTGLTQGIRWRDINCTRLPSGAPTVELRGKAAQRARKLGIERILVTISHGRDLAVANAVALGISAQGEVPSS